MTVRIALVLAAALWIPAPALAHHAEPLRGQWHLDQKTAASTTPDSSGHALTGTVDAATALVTGRFGSAFRFGASTTSGVQVAASAQLEPPAVTALAWVRATADPGNYKTIVAKGGSACTAASFALYTGRVEAPGLQFYLWDGTAVHSSPSAGTGVWDGAWHLVAGTFDGAAVRLYVDGRQVGTGTPAATAIDYALPNRSLHVGEYPNWSICADGAFPGDIDEVRVYGRALTATEIARLAAHPGPAPPPALVPDPPPPPPVQLPRNVSPPRIQAAGGGAFTCLPGTWANVGAAPAFTYRWLIRRSLRGRPETLARTQSYSPGAAVFGYPIACEATFAGPAGPVTATSAHAVFSVAGMNALPAAYGDVRIRGIDVFQTVQPTTGARMFGYRPDGPFDGGLCGGGTPTSWRLFLGVCRLGARDPQFVPYQGVVLDRYKPTSAVVYVDVAGAAATDPGLSYDLELSATRAGRVSLGETVVRRIANPPASATAWVSARERNGGDFKGASIPGIPIRLPSAWTSGGGSIRLHARLRFPDRFQLGTAGYGTRQCDREGCDANDAFTLDDVPFADFPELRIASIQLRRISDGQAALPAAADVLAKARRIFPGGSRVVVAPYSAEFDISGDAALPATPAATGTGFTCNGRTYTDATLAAAQRSCRWDAVAARVTAWIADNPGRVVGTGGIFAGRAYDAVMGVHDYPGEPGAAVGNITSVGRLTPRQAGQTPYFTATSATRPLTAAAHELGHILTAPHASPCNDAGRPEPWPEPGSATGSGRLQGVKFTASTLLGRSLWRAVVDGADPTSTQLFDLMSYCAGGDTAAADGSAWLSPRNWNRFSRELSELNVRLGARALPAVRRLAQAPRGAGFAVGVAGTGGGTITRVVPAGAGDAVPDPDPSSPFVLRSLDAAGHVLLDAGVAVRSSSERSAAGGPFTGPVARGAAAVELRRGAVVLDRVARSRPPKVRLTAPRRGGRVRGGGRLTVRWRASDPDRDRLGATIEYSPGGRGWRTVYDGPSTGRAVLRGRSLPAGRRARVRVRVSDGFTERSATSPPFVALGSPPRAQILTPAPGDPLSSGGRTRLIGAAYDDAGRRIRDRALTWFAGRARLGRGESLRARLPRGTRRLTLVARDRSGRMGVARLRVRVAAPRLRILALDVPLKVSRRARTVTVRIRTSAPAVLAAGGRRYRLPAKAARVRVRLPRRPAVGLLAVRFRLSPRGSGAAGTLGGTFTVART